MKKLKVLKMEFLPRKGVKVLKRASRIYLIFRTSTLGSISTLHTVGSLQAPFSRVRMYYHRNLLSQELHFP